MNKDYISTDSLHGYLAHARTYSHKYIKREPDGHGGYRYYYPTDSGLTSSARVGSYRRYDQSYDGPYLKKNDGLAQMTVTGPRGEAFKYDSVLRQSGRQSESKVRSANWYREADKASQIYREGLSENKLDTKTPNIAQQAISTITTTAKNTYNSGMNFLKNLFSNAITENYTIKDTRGNTIASGSKPSSLSAVANDIVNAGKKWLSNIFGTKKNITYTETRGELRTPSMRC